MIVVSDVARGRALRATATAAERRCCSRQLHTRWSLRRGVRLDLWKPRRVRAGLLPVSRLEEVAPSVVAALGQREVLVVRGPALRRGRRGRLAGRRVRQRPDLGLGGGDGHAAVAGAPQLLLHAVAQHLVLLVVVLVLLLVHVVVAHHLLGLALVICKVIIVIKRFVVLLVLLQLTLGFHVVHGI